MNKTILKWGGVAATAVGAVALFMAGTSEQTVVSLVGAVFVAAGIIASIIKS